MNFGKITIITPPDKLFNMSLSYLLVKPSLLVKQQFQTIISNNDEDITIFIFDDDETDIDWLLSIAVKADAVIIDVDNCDSITKQFISFLLMHNHVHYITNDETVPYNLLSKNRIYDMNWVINKRNLDEEDEDD